MSLVLRIVALLLFFLAVILAQVVDTPDVLDVLSAVAGGLGFWVAATIAGERFP